MIKEIIGIIITFMVTGCSTYTQFSHPSDVNEYTEREKYTRHTENNIHYRMDVCVEYSHYNNIHDRRYLVWDNWKKCWIYDPYRYNGYYNGDYNYWYWHHHNDHHNDDNNYYPPPSNEKKERRENNYVRPPSNNNDDNNSSNENNTSVSSSSNNNSNNINSNDNTNNSNNNKTKRTKTRKRK